MYVCAWMWRGLHGSRPARQLAALLLSAYSNARPANIVMRFRRHNDWNCGGTSVSSDHERSNTVHLLLQGLPEEAVEEQTLPLHNIVDYR